MTHANFQRRRALSMVELMVAMAVSTVLLGAIGSSLVIASRALPNDRSAAGSAIEAYRLADQLSGELYAATAVTAKTSRSITFVVPTRNADAFPETINYSFTGFAGDPLVRQYNGGTAQIVAEDVREFQLLYTTSSVIEQPPPTDNESAEMVLSSADGLLTLGVSTVTASAWIGQYFQPTLPADAVSWGVTRVQLKARSRGAKNGVAAIQIRPATASRTPDVSVLEQASMPESGLSTSFLWQSFAFANLNQLTPGQALCLVVVPQVQDAHVCEIEFGTGVLASKVTTTNSGTTWIRDLLNDVTHYVYGTVTTRSTPPTVTRTYLRAVGIRLRVGSDASTVVQTSIPLLNEPEVTGL